jgi:hypothetical protein
MSYHRNTCICVRPETTARVTCLRVPLEELSKNDAFGACDVCTAIARYHEVKGV